jgi:hypothetical protein
MQVLSPEIEEIEPMGSKDDLHDLKSQISSQISKLADEVKKLASAPPVSRWSKASPVITICALIFAGFSFWANHSAGDLKNTVKIEVGDQLRDPLKQIGEISKDVTTLKAEFEQFNKDRLTNIKDVVSQAEYTGNPIPQAQLASYKQTIGNIPPTLPEYWVTVASIINYQSWLDQSNGHAPNPDKISKPCFGSDQTSHDNLFVDSSFDGCSVYIDSHIFENVIFTNSVIHYQGGPVKMDNARFINCRFVLEIKPALAPSPSSPENRLLVTLLNSPDLKSLSIATHS